MANFVVVLGADSDARFPEGGDSITVSAFPTTVGQANITYLTRHGDEGYESPVPREMWIEVRGESDAEFLEVLGGYANAAAQFLPLIAFSANAWVGDSEPKIAYDATPDRTERRHFQNFVREEVGTAPRPGRNVNTAATISLLEAVRDHPETERLRRGIAQYAMALGHWKTGHETMALAHLYIGMEALTPVAVRRERERLGMDDDELAQHYGVDDRRSGARQGKLHAIIRRQIVFKGDDTAASKARQASDGFEHSFLDFVKVRTLAQEVRDRTARYVRSAVFDISELDPEVRAMLEAPPFDKPLRSFLSRYMWGNLVGKAEDMAEPDQAYPRMTWTSRLKEFRREPDGFYTLTPEETITASFNEKLKYHQTGFEIWGPDGTRPRG